MSEKQNLSKSELAAVDFMIAFLKENNQSNLQDHPGMLAANVTKAANMIYAMDILSVDDRPTKVMVTPVQTAMYATGNQLRSEEFLKTMEQLDTNNVSEAINLENLIAIKNKYSK